jgi:hypothetical protein
MGVVHSSRLQIILRSIMNTYKKELKLSLRDTDRVYINKNKRRFKC